MSLTRHPIRVEPNISTAIPYLFLNQFNDEIDKEYDAMQIIGHHLENMIQPELLEY